MKFLFLFLVAGSAFVSAAYPPINNINLKHDVSTRNRDILRLLNHVIMPNSYVDQVKIGNEFDFMKSYEFFDKMDVVKDFYRIYLKNDLLPKYTVFSIGSEKHRRDAILFFRVLYFAKDYDTFYRVACWGRDRMNEGVYTYSLLTAIMHRLDTNGFYMPPLYEIYPYSFVNSEVIRKAYRVKMSEGFYDTKLANFVGVHKEDNSIIINSNYSGWYMTVNDEQKMTYFTEDIGLNNYYYFFHIMFPFWMSMDVKELKDIRGEVYYYFHQQLMARYYAERLSNGLGPIERINYDLPIRTGFSCSLEYHNGLKCPSRDNFYNVIFDDKYYMVEELKAYERRIIHAVQQGFFRTEDGTVVPLRDYRDINTLGNIVQGNRDSENTRFFQPLYMLAKHTLGGSRIPMYRDYVVPTAMDQYETALRDPMFFQLWHKYLYNFFMRYKNFLKPYTREELIYPGVKINDVAIEDLVTYFDQYDVDITNAVYRNKEEVRQDKQPYSFWARQQRLNHRPFNVKVAFDSDKATDVLVKFFMAPKYDNLRREIPLDRNRHNYFELDSFVYTMQKGNNVLERNSRDFTLTVADWRRTSDVLKGDDLSNTNFNQLLGFPDRLVLPRGRYGGMEYKFFVIISPIRTTKDVKSGSNNFWWSRFLKYEPGMMGYPFDRRIEYAYDFWTPNMWSTDVSIYHTNTDEINKSYTYGQKAAEHGFLGAKYPSKYMDSNYMDSHDNAQDKYMYKNI